MRKKTLNTFFTIDDIEVPVKIVLEYRRSIRASLGKKEATLRLPSSFSSQQVQERIQWLEQWLTNQSRKKKGVLDRFKAVSFLSGDQIQVGQRNYLLRISYLDKKNHSASLGNGLIDIRLSQHAPKDSVLQKNIRHLLSRVISHDFLPEVTRRVHELNETFFKQPIQKVSLKYNLSNWGSCSKRKNINLSSRLLFAPQGVLDYVIIHELAHTLEFNHSARFWKLVEKAMPDYKKKIKWLRENGGKCDFLPKGG